MKPTHHRAQLHKHISAFALILMSPSILISSQDNTPQMPSNTALIQSSATLPDGPTEYRLPEQLPTGITIAECYLKGKKSPATCEDGIAVTPHFIAVIDGATSKSDFSLDGKKSGRLAMEIICRSINTLAPDATMPQALEHITSSIADFYTAHGLNEEIAAAPNKRFVANGVIYSVARRELWQIGDCQLRYADTISSNEKEIDHIMSTARAMMNETALAAGMSPEELAATDPGRQFIMQFLQRQALLQNNPDPRLQHSFPVFDGTPINPSKVKVFKVPANTEIVLSSDGYPDLRPTLAESESTLRHILTVDPMCMHEGLSTKGITPGNLSFDDRAYIRFTHH